ncbi:neutral zinc metallopeptidase [Streptosporangium carneum]|uniref:Peptidase n=1 Tax=Streptosporangium carneum TaxID=47481 RepID=A0A9W6HYJ0_9ACTN|nr:neutral zinc metallopeptidase [Streptosporangium carneum]GLK08136.1 peptidase [Streptosporangium carneum]
MSGPRDWSVAEPRRRGIARRILPAALAFVVVLGGVAYLRGDLQELIGTAPGSPRSAPATHHVYRETGPVDARCDTLPADPDADVRKTLNALSRCLDRMWTATLAEADVDYERPDEVRLVAAPGEAACGVDDYDWAGVYCPDRRVVNVLVEEEQALSTMFTLAHEYAHHVQEISGIADQQGAEVFDEAWSRRLELQADCLAAVTLRGVDSRVLENQLLLAEGETDAADDQAESYRRSHGSGASSAAWIARGKRGGKVASCNTWGAPADEVS